MNAVLSVDQGFRPCVRRTRRRPSRPGPPGAGRAWPAVGRAVDRPERERWPGVDGIELHQADALTYLGGTCTIFDAVYSVFGAAWFTDPGLLLPVVRASLKPAGVFAFSQRPPVEGCYGCQASYIPRGLDEDPAVVKRWDYGPDAWALILKEHGFVDVSVSVLAPPSGSRRTGTLPVRSIRGG